MKSIVLKSLPWASTQRFKLEGLTGPFESCIWSGKTKEGFTDSYLLGGVYYMDVICVSGLLTGNTIRLPWETKVLWLEDK